MFFCFFYSSCNTVVYKLHLSWRDARNIIVYRNWLITLYSAMQIVFYLWSRRGCTILHLPHICEQSTAHTTRGAYTLNGLWWTWTTTDFGLNFIELCYQNSYKLERTLCFVCCQTCFVVYYGDFWVRMDFTFCCVNKNLFALHISLPSLLELNHGTVFIQQSNLLGYTLQVTLLFQEPGEERFEPHSWYESIKLELSSLGCNEAKWFTWFLELDELMQQLLHLRPCCFRIKMLSAELDSWWCCRGSEDAEF